MKISVKILDFLIKKLTAEESHHLGHLELPGRPGGGQKSAPKLPNVGKKSGFGDKVAGGQSFQRISPDHP